MNDLPPVVYEDGHQSRDLVYVEDVARANCSWQPMIARDGGIFNVGTGQAVEIGELARLLAERLGKAIEPLLSRRVSAGRDAGADLRYLAHRGTRLSPRGRSGDRHRPLSGMDRTQGTIKDYFATAERMLRRKRVVKQSARRPSVRSHGMTKPTAAVVIPALNEEATIADLVAEVRIVTTSPDLTVQIAGIFVVDNGSTDATAARAREAGAIVVPEPRRGYGRACLCGVLATGDVGLIVLMDGDRSDVLTNSPALVASPRRDNRFRRRLARARQCGARFTLAAAALR